MSLEFLTYISLPKHLPSESLKDFTTLRINVDRRGGQVNRFEPVHHLFRLEQLFIKFE